MLSILLFCNSCSQLSELVDKPLVMATAAQYNPPGQNVTLLKFTIVYWSDYVSGLTINFYNPDGDLARSWEQPAGVLEKGDPVVVDGFEVMYGKWRLTFDGMVITDLMASTGKSFEDDITVNVNE